MWNSFIPDIECLEHIAKQSIPNITIVEGRGLPHGTHCSIDENHNSILFWDSLMYEFYDKELTLLDTFPYDDDDQIMITEMEHNYIGVLLDHLSERNKKNIRICSALKREANEFGYPLFSYMNDRLPDVSEWCVPYFIQTGVFKLLILYHEIAHALFSKDESERNKWQNLVIDNIRLFLQNFDDFHLGFDVTTNDEIICILKQLASGDNKYCVLLEEISADVYALSHAYATTHRNLKMVDSETLSDNIMLAYLRYTDISSQYGYIVDYWKELYGHCVAKKKKNSDDNVDLLKKNTILNAIRCEVYGLLSIINIIQSDIDTWNYNPPEGISLSDPRIKKVMHVFTINANTLSSVTAASVSPNLFNLIVEESNNLSNEEANTPFEYPTIPPNATLITWLSVQYHNSIGLDFFNKKNYTEALKAYQLAAIIVEQYLGPIHKLTARQYNNICSCYIGKALYYITNNMAKDSSEFAEYLELASFHSSKAINILELTNKTKDMQAGAIYQNAGEICMMYEQYKQAADFYLKAQTAKEQNPLGYDDSAANTDYSLSVAYYKSNMFLDAKKNCKKALDYYRSKNNGDDTKQKEIEDFYNRIVYMMSPIS